MEDINTKTMLVIISASVGALAVIVGQFIVAYVNLKTKKIEQVYTRKADTYKNLMEKAGAFANDLTNDEKDENYDKKYLEFIHAYYATFIIASTPVLKEFENENSITKIALQLRTDPPDTKEHERLKESWKTAVNKLSGVMREDLEESSQIIKPKLIRRWIEHRFNRH